MARSSMVGRPWSRLKRCCPIDRNQASGIWVRPSAEFLARRAAIHRRISEQATQRSNGGRPKQKGRIGAHSARLGGARKLRPPKAGLGGGLKSIRVIDNPSMRSSAPACGPPLARDQRDLASRGLFAQEVRPHIGAAQGALTICLHAGGNPASVSAGFGLSGCGVDSLNQKSSSLLQPSFGSGGTGGLHSALSAGQAIWT